MKAAVYCRLSEEDRNKRRDTDDSGSIQNQKALLLQYAKAQGWDVYGVYSDDDYTGSDRSRPAFRQLLQDAEQRRFEIILCKTQSRFTRELELVEKYLHGLFPRWGIRFVSVVDNADTENAGNKKSRQINGLVNEWYLEDMSKNIRSVLVNRRENGFHIGSTALYGYQKDPLQKGHLLIDETAAAVVRKIFALFVQGCGKTAIARMLNEQGIPNPTEYKRLHGICTRLPPGKSGTLWKYPAISHILSNEMYIGNMVQGKYGSESYKTKKNRPRPKNLWYRVEHTHEAVISLDLWNQAQALLSQRTKPFSGGSIGLFAGKTRCACCGYTLRSSKSHGRHYLQCPTRRVSKDTCTGSFIAAETLEQIVLNELQRLCEQYLDAGILAQSLPLSAGIQRQMDGLQACLTACKKKETAYIKSLQTLYLDRAAGAITDPDFIRLRDGLTAGRIALSKQLQDTQEQLDVLKAQTAVEAGQSPYSHPQRLTREMVDLLIEFITIGKRTLGEPHPPVEIHWRF